jgi:carbon monoxide dehydrogenase subunit G
MDLTHRFSVPAPVEEVWTALTHLDRLVSCFPGAKITGIEAKAYLGSVRVKLGPLTLVYGGATVYRVIDQAARRVVLEARGQDQRGQGTAVASWTITLEANDALTNVVLRTELTFAGPAERFGPEAIRGVANRTIDQFLDCLSPRFAAGLGAPGGDRAAGAAQPGRGRWTGSSTSSGAQDAAEWPGVTAGVTNFPPADTRRSDLEVLSAVVPGLVRRYRVPATGGLVLLWVTAQVVRRALR